MGLRGRRWITDMVTAELAAHTAVETQELNAPFASRWANELVTAEYGVTGATADTSTSEVEFLASIPSHHSIPVVPSSPDDGRRCSSRRHASLVSTASLS